MDGDQFVFCDPGRNDFRDSRVAYLANNGGHLSS
jgi:hypothetical protein